MRGIRWGERGQPEVRELALQRLRLLALDLPQRRLLCLPRERVHCARVEVELAFGPSSCGTQTMCKFWLQGGTFTTERTYRLTSRRVKRSIC